MKHKFTIYGCCVTRDIFNFLDNEIYNPNITIGASPIMSLFSDGINVELEDIDISDSNYINRMIYNNIVSKTLDVLRESDSEYLIFDLAEERLPIQDWKLGNHTSVVPVTWNTHRTSVKLKKKDKYENLYVKNWRFPDIDISLYRENINRFINEIKKKYSQDKIIYIPLQQVEDVFDEDSYCMKSLSENKNEFSEGIESVAFRKKQNRIIKLVENIVLEELPDCWIVPIPEGIFASTRHHLGVHPLHFADIFYEYCAEAVKLIVKDRGGEEPDRKIVSKNINFLCKRYENKVLLSRKQLHDNGKKQIQFVGAKQYDDIWSDLPDVNKKNSICDVAISSFVTESLSVHKFENDNIEFLNDANKNNIDAISYGETEWIVLDLLSECRDKIVVDGIGEMMNNYGDIAVDILKRKYADKEIKVIKYDEQPITQVIEKLLQFVSKIKSKYVEEKIVINEAYYHNSYVNNEGIIVMYGNEIYEKNLFLKKLYEEIYRVIPKCKVIKMPNVASYNEKMPEYKTMYEYVYYKRILNALLKQDEDEYEALINECKNGLDYCK